MEDKKVNLFIVGAMRAGTTSFMELLSKHPDIYVSPIKEPHFFVDELPEAIFEPQPDNFLDNYFKKKFPKPIHRAHVRTVENYRNLFQNATNQKYLAEGSVSYLHAPDVAAKLKRYNPNAKIIILTRDPLERAYSHYRMNVGLFREERTFEEALQQEVSAYYKNELSWYSYLFMSFYKVPSTRFMHCFSMDVLTISFENLIANTPTTFKEISRFLKIDPFESQIFPNLNSSKTVRFKNSLGIINNLYSNRLKLILPHWLKEVIKFIVLYKKNNNISINGELHKNILKIFKNEC